MNAKQLLMEAEEGTFLISDRGPVYAKGHAGWYQVSDLPTTRWHYSAHTISGMMYPSIVGPDDVWSLS